MAHERSEASIKWIMLILTLVAIAVGVAGGIWLVSSVG